jgi:hypothetical protein
VRKLKVLHLKLERTCAAKPLLGLLPLLLQVLEQVVASLQPGVEVPRESNGRSLPQPHLVVTRQRRYLNCFEMVVQAFDAVSNSGTWALKSLR